VSVPWRTCVACRRSRPKPELIRLVCATGTVHVDPSGSLPGRGAYLCGLPECTTTALRRDGAVVRRALRLGDRRAVMDADALRVELHAARDCNDEHSKVSA